MVILTDWTLDILRLAIILFSAVITYHFARWLRALREDARHRELVDAIAAAVTAAEQAVEGSEAKKDYVTAYMAEWLLSRGVSITVKELDTLIESAVYGVKLGKANLGA